MAGQMNPPLSLSSCWGCCWLTTHFETRLWYVRWSLLSITLLTFMPVGSAVWGCYGQYENMRDCWHPTLPSPLLPPDLPPSLFPVYWPWYRAKHPPPTTHSWRTTYPSISHLCLFCSTLWSMLGVEDDEADTQCVRLYKQMFPRGKELPAVQDLDDANVAVLACVCVCVCI